MWNDQEVVQRMLVGRNERSDVTAIDSGSRHFAGMTDVAGTRRTRSGLQFFLANG